MDNDLNVAKKFNDLLGYTAWKRTEPESMSTVSEMRTLPEYFGTASFTLEMVVLMTLNKSECFPLDYIFPLKLIEGFSSIKWSVTEYHAVSPDRAPYQGIYRVGTSTSTAHMRSFLHYSTGLVLDIHSLLHAIGLQEFQCRLSVMLIGILEMLNFNVMREVFLTERSMHPYSSVESTAIGEDTLYKLIAEQVDDFGRINKNSYDALKVMYDRAQQRMTMNNQGGNPDTVIIPGGIWNTTVPSSIQSGKMGVSQDNIGFDPGMGHITSSRNFKLQRDQNNNDPSKTTAMVGSFVFFDGDCKGLGIAPETYDHNCLSQVVFDYNLDREVIITYTEALMKSGLFAEKDKIESRISGDSEDFDLAVAKRRARANEVANSLNTQGYTNARPGSKRGRDSTGGASVHRYNNQYTPEGLSGSSFGTQSDELNTDNEWVLTSIGNKVLSNIQTVADLYKGGRLQYLMGFFFKNSYSLKGAGFALTDEEKKLLENCQNAQQHPFFNEGLGLAGDPREDYASGYDEPVDDLDLNTFRGYGLPSSKVTPRSDRSNRSDMSLDSLNTSRSTKDVPLMQTNPFATTRTAATEPVISVTVPQTGSGYINVNSNNNNSSRFKRVPTMLEHPYNLVLQNNQSVTVHPILDPKVMQAMFTRTGKYLANNGKGFFKDLSGEYSHDFLSTCHWSPQPSFDWLRYFATDPNLKARWNHYQPRAVSDFNLCDNLNTSQGRNFVELVASTDSFIQSFFKNTRPDDKLYFNQPGATVNQWNEDNGKVLTSVFNTMINPILGKLMLPQAQGDGFKQQMSLLLTHVLHSAHLTSKDQGIISLNVMHVLNNAAKLLFGTEIEANGSLLGMYNAGDRAKIEKIVVQNSENSLTLRDLNESPLQSPPGNVLSESDLIHLLVTPQHGTGVHLCFHKSSKVALQVIEQKVTIHNIQGKNMYLYNMGSVEQMQAFSALNFDTESDVLHLADTNFIAKGHHFQHLIGAALKSMIYKIKEDEKALCEEAAKVIAGAIDNASAIEVVTYLLYLQYRCYVDFQIARVFVHDFLAELYDERHNTRKDSTSTLSHHGSDFRRALSTTVEKINSDILSAADKRIVRKHMVELLCNYPDFVQRFDRDLFVFLHDVVTFLVGIQVTGQSQANPNIYQVCNYMSALVCLLTRVWSDCSKEKDSDYTDGDYVNGDEMILLAKEKMPGYVPLKREEDKGIKRAVIEQGLRMFMRHLCYNQEELPKSFVDNNWRTKMNQVFLRTIALLQRNLFNVNGRGAEVSQKLRNGLVEVQSINILVSPKGANRVYYELIEDLYTTMDNIHIDICLAYSGEICPRNTTNSFIIDMQEMHDQAVFKKSGIKPSVPNAMQYQNKRFASGMPHMKDMDSRGNAFILYERAINRWMKEYTDIARWFRLAIIYNIPLFWGVLMFRPHQQYLTGTTCIMTRGATVGETFYGNQNCTSGIDPMVKTLMAHFSFDTTTVCFRPEKLVHFDHSVVIQYLSGGGIKHYAYSEADKSRYQRRSLEEKSIFFCAVPPNYKADKPYMDITGRFPEKYVGGQGAGSAPHYPTCSIYCDFWGWDSDVSLYGTTSVGSKINTLVCQDFQKSYDPATKSFTRVTINRGHLGSKVYAGAMAVFNNRRRDLLEPSYMPTKNIIVGGSNI